MKHLKLSIFLFYFLTTVTQAQGLVGDDYKHELSSITKLETQNLLATLSSLVNIESGSHDAEGLILIRKEIGKKLDDLGIQYEILTNDRFPDNKMVHVRIKGKGKTKIALIAHMDTVYQKGDLAKQMFRIDEGRAYGLGISDDKAGVAVILHVLKIIKELNVDSFGELAVLINSDEEIGSNASKEKIISLGEESDLVISFEGSSVKSDYVRLSTSSIASADITVHGRASHAGASPENGRNALYELSHQILKTRDLNRIAKGVKFNWTLSNAGTVGNMIPFLATAHADIRADNSKDFDLVEDQLRKELSEHLIADTTIDLKFIRSRPSLMPTEKSLKVAQLAKSIANEIDWNLSILTVPTGGGTDAAYAQVKSKGAVIESFGLQGFGGHSKESEYVLINSIPARLYTTVRLIDEFSRSTD